MSMYLRLFRRLLARVSAPTVTAIPSLPRHGWQRLQDVDPVQFAAVYQSGHRLTECQSLYPTLVRYTQVLEQATLILRDGGSLNPHLYNPTPVTLPVWRLFLDERGDYGSPVQTFATWQSAALAFLTQYAQIDAAVGSPMEYNLRILDQVLNNTVSLTQLFADWR